MSPTKHRTAANNGQKAEENSMGTPTFSKMTKAAQRKLEGRIARDLDASVSKALCAQLLSEEAAAALWEILAQFGHVDSAGGMEWQHRMPEFIEQFRTMSADDRAEVAHAALVLATALEAAP